MTQAAVSLAVNFIVVSFRRMDAERRILRCGQDPRNLPSMRREQVRYASRRRHFMRRIEGAPQLYRARRSHT